MENFSDREMKKTAVDVVVDDSVGVYVGQLCTYLVLPISSKIVIFHWFHGGDSIRVGSTGLSDFAIEFGGGECVDMFMFFQCRVFD